MSLSLFSLSVSVSVPLSVSLSLSVSLCVSVSVYPLPEKKRRKKGALIFLTLCFVAFFIISHFGFSLSTLPPHLIFKICFSVYCVEECILLYAKTIYVSVCLIVLD